MAREIEGYRDMIERMDERFPGKEILNGQEICDFTGWSRTTMKRRIGAVQKGVAKCVLAKKILLATER